MILWLLACSGADSTEAPVTATPETPEPVQQPAVLELRVPDKQAKTQFATTLSPDLERTLAELGAVVDKYAADPTNPWAIGHGMLARGPGFMLTNGEPALPYLYATYAEVATIEGVEYPAFPRETPEGINVEPHTDLMLKVITEAGVDPSTTVIVEGKEFEVADTWRHTLKTTFIRVDERGESTSFDSPNDMPWGVQSLAHWGTEDMAWTAYEGTDMSMDDTTKLMVHVLTSESDFIIRSMVTGDTFTKQKQGIHAYTCGGAHLLQGSAFAVARGYGNSDDRDKMTVNGKVLYYRYNVEVPQVDAMIAEYPNFRIQLLSQQLKFIGHFLESAHKLSALDLYQPDALEQQTLNTAVDDLIRVVKQLKALGALDNLGDLRKENEQLYLDLVGDSAHAINGVELALGNRTIGY